MRDYPFSEVESYDSSINKNKYNLFNLRKFNVHKNGKCGIIIRTKDRPILLARAINGVLNQSYSNWHIYLVNDGGNKEILEKVLKPYIPLLNNSITIIHHEKSLGMETASNSALKAMKDCNYVVVHDDDDSWHPDFLKEAVSFLENPENSIFGGVVTDCEVVYEEIKGDTIVEMRRERWGFLPDTPLIDLLNIIPNNLFPPICFLIRKEVFDLVGEFNSESPVLGDWDFNLRVLMSCDIGRIPKVLAYYHHRVTKDAYGNSVHAQGDLHLKYNILYRNSWVRLLLQQNPGYLGLLHMLLLRLNHIHWDVNSPQWATPVIQFSVRGNKIIEPLRIIYRIIKKVKEKFKR